MKFKSAIIFLISTIVVIFFLLSCLQQEGIGGNSHIKGKFFVNYYNDDFSVLLSDKPEPAKDEDVFLIFGNETIIGEDTKTSFSGDFKFEYLWPGKYKIYYFSADTTGKSSEKVEVIKEIILKKNETLDLGELIIRKKLKWDEGTSFIKGRIMVNYYNDDFSMLLSDKPLPAKDEDVFLIFENRNVIGKDTKTSYTGDFEFSNLWPGRYQIFFYSDDTTGVSPEKVEILNDVALGKSQTYDLNNLLINKSLNWDEGTSSVKGTVNVINYLNSSSYPNLEIKDITPAQEQEIYITYGNHPFYDERIRTSSDGSFMFQNLIKGKYHIFLYSEDITGGTAYDFVEKEFEITENEQDVVLKEIIYIKKL
jgi:hypothetical protein